MTTRRQVSGLRKAAGLILMMAATGSAASAQSGPAGRRIVPQIDPASVPEIDPASALAALTVLAGGLLVVTDRRRAKSIEVK